MSKRKSNDEEQPSTSRDVENEKRIRLEFNFWEENDVEQNISAPAPTKLNIRDLKIGKYMQQLLKIRITYLSNVRKIKLGDVINFHGIDCNSTEISFYTFGEYCKNIFNYLKINSLYSVKNFSVNEENVQFPSGSGHKLQIKLHNNVEIEELDVDENFPKILFKFQPLESVHNLNKNEQIDVIGIFVKDFGLDKNYKGTSMRELVITDVSKSQLILTLWGVNAEMFSVANYSVLVIRKAIITEFEGKKKLNCIAGTLVWSDADIFEAVQLKREFQELTKNKHLTENEI